MSASPKEVSRKKFGALDTIEVNFSKGVSKDGSSEAPRAAVVMLHGFGADFTDLVSLSEVVDSPRSVRWFFPNGVHSVVLGPHMTGRAWFPLRLAELEANGVDFEQSTPEGMEKAVNQAFMACDEIRKQNGLSWDHMILGGFSQGSMIALQVALLVAEKSGQVPAGLILFSSALVDEPRLREKLQSLREGQGLKGVRFFQSHGTSDSLLEFDGAERLDAVLNEHGLDGMLLAFNGGHEIPMPVLREWGSWLKSFSFWNDKK